MIEHGMSFEQFREDPKTVAAEERKFPVIDLEIIWQTFTDDLPPLKAAVLKALQSAPGAESHNRQHPGYSFLYPVRAGLSRFVTALSAVSP
jgi:uncharacterized protein with HEPN domain